MKVEVNKITAVVAGVLVGLIAGLNEVKDVLELDLDSGLAKTLMGGAVLLLAVLKPMLVKKPAIEEKVD